MMNEVLEHASDPLWLERRYREDPVHFAEAVQVLSRGQEPPLGIRFWQVRLRPELALPKDPEIVNGHEAVTANGSADSPWWRRIFAGAL